MSSSDESETPGRKPGRFPIWPYLPAFLVLVLLGVAFGEMAEAARRQSLGNFDQAVNGWVLQHRDEWPCVGKLARAVTWIGNPEVAYLVIVLIALGLVGLHARRLGEVRRIEAPFWLGVMLGGQLLNVALKAIFQRARPPELSRWVVEDTSSFPSGHSVFGAVFFSMLAVLLIRSLGRLAVGWKVVIALACATLGLLVAGSRVWLAVHYPTDVIGGLVLGLGWVIAAWTVRYTWARWTHLRRANRSA